MLRDSDDTTSPRLSKTIHDLRPPTHSPRHTGGTQATAPGRVRRALRRRVGPAHLGAASRLGSLQARRLRQFFQRCAENRAARSWSSIARMAAIIGSSRFNGYDAEKSEIEIGWTFLARSHWGGRFNGEMKQLMVGHALKYRCGASSSSSAWAICALKKPSRIWAASVLAQGRTRRAAIPTYTR